MPLTDGFPARAHICPQTTPRFMGLQIGAARAGLEAP
jgi:hypothetical protein